ncbi:MAG: protein-glutamate O-methyltransferase CheR [Deltaproteobacteria bacterium]|nr:protein-glutamate O-methyltransferase CheR [Deltaproteobacteria bacterium]
MSFITPRHRLDEDEFRVLRTIVNDYAGIYFHDEMHYILERRLSARIDELGLSGFSDYIRYIRFNPRGRSELEETVELLSTNETYFFREDFQLKAFTDEILPLMSKSGRKSLRIWSAGCSSGEEPYTIAMLFLESSFSRKFELDIFASDISRNVLALARKGTYGKGSFRQTPALYLSRYFSRRENKHKISDHLKSMVTFGHLNLLERDKVEALGKFDIIFCRNVLIYFDIPSKKKVVGSFYNALRPGGFLLLGHSESLMNISTAFELVHFRNDMVYRKPEKHTTV